MMNMHNRLRRPPGVHVFVAAGVESDFLDAVV